MSLIAHYPLIKNVNDLSINSNHGSIQGATFVTGGKLGGSAKFTASADKILIPHHAEVSAKVFGTGNTASISVWVYLTEWPAVGVYGVIFSKSLSAFYSNFTIGVMATEAGYQCVIGTNQPGNPAGGYELVNSKPSLNAWHHLLVVLNKTVLQFYVDGVLIGSKPLANVSLPRSENTTEITIGPRTSSYVDSYLRGNVADLRIYDHVLSARERLDLVRAKVAHYKFTDKQEYTRNNYGWYGMISDLLPGNSVVITTPNAAATPIKITCMGELKYKFEYTQDVTGLTSWTVAYAGASSSDYYTFSGVVEEYNLAAGSTGKFGFRLDKNTALDYLDADVISGSNGLGRKIITYPKGSPLAYVTMFLQDANTVKAGSYIIVSQFQCEPSPFATEYYPSTTTRAALITDNSGYDRDIEVYYTSSGYNVPKWTAESPVGKGSYDFSYSPSRLQIPYGYNVNLTTFPHTFSMWVKTSITTGNEVFFSCDIATGKLLYIRKNGGKWTFSVQSNEVTTGTISVIANKWTHIALVMEGATGKLYVDGVLGETKSYTTFDLPSDFNLGMLYNSPSITWNGLISEVSIHSSAFSANDVMDLYTNRGWDSEETGILKVQQFSSSTGAMCRFTEAYSLLPDQTTINFVRDGKANITSTGLDPKLFFVQSTTPDFFDGFNSLDPAAYKYLQMRYCITSSTNTTAEVYFMNGRRPGANADQRSNTVALTGDGKWRTATFDFTASQYWTDSPLIGFRLDYASISGVTIEIEYIRLVKDTKQVDFRETGVMEAKGIMTNGPLNGLTHWFPLDGKPDEIANATPTNQTVTQGQYVSFINSMGCQFVAPASGATTFPSFMSPLPGDEATIRHGSLSFWVNIQEPAVGSAWTNPGFEIFRLQGFQARNNGIWLKMFANSSTTLQVVYSLYGATSVPTDNITATIPNAPATFTQNSRVHVVVIYSDAYYSGVLEVYVNGVRIDVRPITPTMNPAWRSQLMTFMSDRTTRTTSGIISDIRFYNRYLTGQDVNLIYESFGDGKNRLKYLETGELYIKNTLKEV